MKSKALSGTLIDIPISFKVEPSLRQELYDFTQILPELREEIEKKKQRKAAELWVVVVHSNENTAFHFIIGNIPDKWIESEVRLP